MRCYASPPFEPSLIGPGLKLVVYSLYTCTCHGLYALTTMDVWMRGCTVSFTAVAATPL
jgi:hypothetical protein